MQGSGSEEAVDRVLGNNRLARKSVPKDGACLFRCASELIYGSQVMHQEMRIRCVSYMQNHRDDFEPFVTGCSDLPWDHYLFELQKPETWGGSLELQALSLIYKVNFLIYSNDSQPTCIDNGYPRSLPLSFTSGNHYDVVYPVTTCSCYHMCQGLLFDMLDSMFHVDIPSSREWRNLAYEWWLNDLKKQEMTDGLICKKLDVRKPTGDFSKLTGYHKKNNDDDKHTPNQTKSNRKRKNKNKRAKPALALDIVVSEPNSELQDALHQISLAEAKAVKILEFNDNFPSLPGAAKPPKSVSPLPSTSNLSSDSGKIHQESPTATTISEHISAQNSSQGIASSPATPKSQNAVSAWKTTKDWNR